MSTNVNKIVNKFPSRVTVRQALGLFVAAFIPTLQCKEETLFHLMMIFIAVAGVQLSIIYFIARRLSSLLNKKNLQLNENDAHVLCNFPTISMAAAFISSLVLSIPLLLAASHFNGLGLGALPIEFGPTYAIIQAAFALVVYKISKTQARRLTLEVSWPKPLVHAVKKRALSTAPLQALLIAIGGAVIYLTISAQQIAEANHLQNSLNKYEMLLQAIIDAKQRPSGIGIAPMIDTLSHVKGVTPFYITIDNPISLSLDKISNKMLLEGIKSKNKKVRINYSLNQGIKWAPNHQNNSMTVGVGVNTSGRSLLPTHSIILILMAIAVAVSISLWIRASMKRFSMSSIEYLKRIPDNRKIPASAASTQESHWFQRAMISAQYKYISDREHFQQLKKEGHESRSKKSQIFASMSHDLRSPLNSIIGFTDLLLNGIGGSLNTAQKKTVSHISQESERLMVLIGDILDTAKLDADRFELDLQWIPSVELLTDCIEGANRLVANKDVAFESLLEPGLPPVKVDKERVARALLGIVARAVDSMKHGTITLKASKSRGLNEQPDKLRIDIIDTSMGTEKLERKKIIHAFNSTQQAEDEVTGGTELGLSLAKRVVQLHGGEIEIEYSNEQVLTFSVTLPIEDTKENIS